MNSLCITFKMNKKAENNALDVQTPCRSSVASARPLMYKKEKN